MNTDTRKQAIITALRKFVAQRPGMDPRNYDRGGYLRESREVTRDRHDAEALLRRIELSDSITADAILAEASGGGRLTIEQKSQCQNCQHTVRVSLLAPVKDYSERVAPGEAEPAGECRICGAVSHVIDAFSIGYCTGQYFPTEYRKAVARLMASVLWTWTREQCMPAPTLHHNSETGETVERHNGLRAGDWLRAHFRREFGKALAEKYFS